MCDLTIVLHPPPPQVGDPVFIDVVTKSLPIVESTLTRWQVGASAMMTDSCVRPLLFAYPSSSTIKILRNIHTSYNALLKYCAQTFPENELSAPDMHDRTGTPCSRRAGSRFRGAG